MRHPLLSFVKGADRAKKKKIGGIRHSRPYGGRRQTRNSSLVPEPAGGCMIKALGWLLLVASTGSLALFLYAAVFSRLLPEPSKQENFLLWAIREDDYYHLLVPVTVPVAVVAVYLNWFSINLFKSS